MAVTDEAATSQKVCYSRARVKLEEAMTEGNAADATPRLSAVLARFACDEADGRVRRPRAGSRRRHEQLVRRGHHRVGRGVLKPFDQLGFEVWGDPFDAALAS